MITAIIELTESCNLGCTFCLRPSFKKQTMTVETLERVIKELLRYSIDRVDFVWHGGEPLILGIDFYNKIIEFQIKYKNKKTFIRNNVQTNATLLTKEFEDFFQKYDFDIGTSIQGTKEIHDKTRIDMGGKGTYERVIKKISNLQTKPSVICVLTKDILGKEKETYEVLKKNSRGARISEYFPGGLIPSVGKTKDSTMPTPKEYGKSMIKFYEIWKNDKEPINLKPITEIIRAFVQGESGSCIYSQKACNFGVVGVKENGDFYTCLRAAGKSQFFLGNSKDKPLSNLKKYGERDYNQRLKDLKKKDCLKCESWNQCNGGCPQESFKLFGNYSHKTYFCEGRKMLFNHIKKDLKELENEI